MLNLRRILEIKHIPAKACAAFLEISEKSLYNKTTEATEFTFGESRKLKELLPEYDIDYLLSTDNHAMSFDRNSEFSISDHSGA